MADSNSDLMSEWTIELIPVTDAGRAFYLAEYKPFRLAALKQDPDGAFYEAERRDTKTMRCNAMMRCMR